MRTHPLAPRSVAALVTALVVALLAAGALPLAGGAPPAGAAPVGTTGVVEIALTPSGDGAYLVDTAGRVTTLGAAVVHGDAPALATGERVTTLLPSAAGYLLVSDAGRVFARGDAVHRGDLAGVALNGPIVDAAATVDGAGYWLLGSDGGVFSFGSARFAGSTGNLRLNRPANGIVPDPDGAGYWFVADDGGVFAFDAPFRGSMGATPLNRPVVGMIRFGSGYLMVASDGGVFTFSDRPYLGSLGDRPGLTSAQPVTAIAAGPDWYVLVRSDGTIFPFGPGTPSWASNAAGTAPPPGNPAGTAVVPAGAGPVDTTHPDHVVGNGTAASCTSAAVVAAVAQGGIITFSCGPDPVTIPMTATAKIVNTTGPDIVIDGGGKVTLDGLGVRRILYMNTCDPAQVWTTTHCQDQDTPRLVVQNLTFRNGNATGQTFDGGGGGAIFVRGGRFRVVSSRFEDNVCETTGPEVGGGAIRVLHQYQVLPVYVVNSSFARNSCSNGGALSSIDVTWVVLNSEFEGNTAVGVGANPVRPGTPGGGNGGAIYNDGNTYSLRVAGSVIEDNDAREGGGAIFFVSNDQTGTLRIEGSTLRRNPSHGFETAGYPGIYYEGNGPPQVVGSTLA